MRNSAALLLLLTAAGCSWTHDFRLEDLEKIRLGGTSFGEAKAILRSKDQVTGNFFSSEQVVVPPEPLSWISWPLFLHRHDRAYRLELLSDARGIVEAAS